MPSRETVNFRRERRLGFSLFSMTVMEKKGGGRRLEGWKRGQKGCIFSLEKEFANIVVKDAKISCERHKMASFQNGLYDF